MEMDKATLLTGDYYVIDVVNDEDAPVCICIAAIMDYWLYNRKRKDPATFGVTINERNQLRYSTGFFTYDHIDDH